MKNNYNSKAVFLGIIILCGLFFYFQSGYDEKAATDESVYALQVIEQDSFWIYEVYNDKALFIRQEYIPAVKGRQVFKSKADAEKIGNLVISKLAESKMPVISQKDLKANAIRFKKI